MQAGMCCQTLLILCCSAVQQQNINANGAITFFLADQQAAIQLVQSNNPNPSGTPTIPGSPMTPITTSLSPPPPSGSNVGGVPTQTPLPTSLTPPPPASLEPPPPASPAAPFAPGAPEGATSPQSVVQDITGGQGTSMYFPTSSLSSASGLTNLGIPTLVGPNQAVTVPLGQRVSIQLNLKDNVGELYLLAYYNP